MAAHHAESDRNTMLDGHFSCFNLIAHQPHGLGIGTNENQIVGLASLNQFRTFGEETIARMYSICTRIQSRINYSLDIQVGILQCSAT